jgi:predicted SAM-dependent methyltransferase
MRLHIGGEVRKEGWTVLNAQAGPHVDIVGSCVDLSQLGNGTVEEVYASHVLEHLGYAAELPRALAEIARVLRPGGRLMVSVPDFEILCWLFLHPRATPEGKIEIMRCLFGGQTDAYDFHKVGLWGTHLANLLFQAGFADVRRVPHFELFDDASRLTINDVPISLNVIATKRG